MPSHGVHRGCHPAHLNTQYRGSQTQNVRDTLSNGCGVSVKITQSHRRERRNDGVARPVTLSCRPGYEPANIPTRRYGAVGSSPFYCRRRSLVTRRWKIKQFPDNSVPQTGLAKSSGLFGSRFDRTSNFATDRYQDPESENAKDRKPERNIPCEQCEFTVGPKIFGWWCNELCPLE